MDEAGISAKNINVLLLPARQPYVTHLLIVHFKVRISPQTWRRGWDWMRDPDSIGQQRSTSKDIPPFP